MSGSTLYSADVAADLPLWHVGALVAAVADALRARFNPVRVAGEVSGLTRAASGHVYFTLKDEQGQLRVAMFRRAVEAGGGHLLRDGAHIEMVGRLDVYAPRGDLQLIAERVRLAGQGSLYEQFLRLKAMLAAEGLFEAARKRTLPRYPTSLGVVTSPDAAALRDVATTLRRRAPHLPVRLYPAAVQGAEAPAQLCAALQRAYRDFETLGAPQVLLLVRGGGSLEDLWAFNDATLVRTIAQAPMPVITGVGHETDFTLADFAADVRAATPTAAAELCAPAREELLEALQRLRGRLRDAVERRLDERAQRLDRLAQRLGRPSQAVARQRQALLAHQHRLQRALQGWLLRQHQRHEAAQTRLQAALHARVPRERQRLLACAHRLPLAASGAWRRAQAQLQQAQARLALLDPQRVLERGYALVTDEAGHVVTDARRARLGQRLQMRLARGALRATVDAIAEDASAAILAPPRG
ncbi:Exodeoxyribonuclease 7 large subunit [Tepidimonas alkaliphilus]|uniref:Exodeoxyribonuclease 7 large subunit n=1 Tax=Tepidimonas alkaliphilus TaxID=2588942 RepID=A0A554W8Q4_9BURK|nr:exodeoxyribonuclease VII large subunit [Tepidimonas alkaliphilus]TSE19956.1 Exodeoxyribonuclease 7 large subunit [Tepidimonas alkaliphilus]